ncbi:MAG TPA: hypothetical protein VKU00_04160 [Chthonomonadaceae bacterium]|nr:hypothetical protein [Chthonomonadaceae bacterium]
MSLINACRLLGVLLTLGPAPQASPPPFLYATHHPQFIEKDPKGVLTYIGIVPVRSTMPMVIDSQAHRLYLAWLAATNEKNEDDHTHNIWRFAILDTRTDKVLASVKYALPASGVLLTADPARKRIYAVLDGCDRFLVMDGASAAIVRTQACQSATPVAISPDKDRLYMLDKDGQSIHVLSAQTFHEIDQWSIRAAYLTVCPRQQALCSILSGSDAVEVIDCKTGQPRASIPFAPRRWQNNQNLKIAVNPVTGRLYTPNGSQDERLAVMDVATHRLLRTVSIGPFLNQIAVDPMTDRVFVAAGYQIVVLDGKMNTILTKIGSRDQVDTISIDTGLSKIYVCLRCGLVLAFQEAPRR